MAILSGLIRGIRIRFRRYRIHLCPLLLAAGGCAGPSTPLGAVWAVHPSQVNTPKLSYIASVFEKTVQRVSGAALDPSVTFFPGRQILHAPTPLTVVIYEPAGIPLSQDESLKNITIRHNGLDVTKSFMMQATIKVGKNRMFIRIPKVRLQANRDHQIEVIYGSAGRHVYARLDPPHCAARSDHGVFSTEVFKPSPDLIQKITENARERGFSPAFVAALIAQESGFESKRISWAKAIGLTQVTAVAEDELSEKLPGFNNYPRFPGLNDMPYMWVQTLIATGQINETNEWRLDTARSIRGGLAYLDIVAGRWNTNDNRERIIKIFGEEEYDEALTKLILASYNSGYSRVWSALIRFEYSWQISPDLKEARKYVGRITSYCDSFSEPVNMSASTEELLELYHENET